VEAQTKFTQPTPLVEECGFYNFGKSGILSVSSDPTIQKCCFKGSYGEACMKIEGGQPYIKQCYMASEGDSIPIGLLFTEGASGKARKTTIWDYNSCAVEIDSTSNPDFGTSDSIGCNWFEEVDSGEYYFVSTNVNDTIQARSNYWEDDSLLRIQGNIDGNVDIPPILSQWDVCFPYYPDLCADLPPSDPEFNPGKIAVLGEEGERTPLRFSLSQNYPNPFNPETVIKYDLPQAEQVKLTIYNILGQKVRILVDEYQDAGCKTLFWNGRDGEGKDVASGIYFFQLKAGGFEAVKRMVVLR
jgi:hypothetical protein